jgi:hypothetical protein
VGAGEPSNKQLKILLKWKFLENHSLFVCNSLLYSTIYKLSAFCRQNASTCEGIGEWGVLVGGFAT